jgi:RNA polymerase sigma factor (sigma-70 family)
MDDDDRQAQRFEAHRGHVRAVAYRMLGSAAEADDAVQEAWVRFRRADTSGVGNLGGWLTRVVSRVCLDVLRARRARAEEPLGAEAAGSTGSSAVGGAEHGPEEEAELAESVGLALLVVLDRLAPAERVAFVLHDLFAVPFDEIAPIVERSPVATKKLASRARHRVRGAAPAPASGPGSGAAPGVDLGAHARVVEAFLAAARGGDLATLLTVLAPDVVRRADAAAIPPGVPAVLRGAQAVAEETPAFAHRARFAAVALVDGRVGAVIAPAGRLQAALLLTIVGGTITEVDIVADPARLAALDVALVAA